MAIGSYSGASVVVDVTGGISISPIPSTKIKPYCKFFVNDSDSYSMNVDGSSTPKVFTVAPQSGYIWYCEHLTFGIDDGGTCPPSNYGALSELTNGVLIELVRGTSEIQIANLRNNGDIALCFNHSVGFFENGKFMATSNGFFGKLVFATCIALDGTNGDKFRVTIRDNLSSLTFQRMSAQVWEIEENG